MEDEEELTEEEQAKHDRLRKKMDQFLTDITPDMLPDDMLEKIEKKIVSVMKKEGIVGTLSSLHALSVGFEFGMASHASLGTNSMAVSMGIKHMLKKRRDAKGEIDITKTKAMPN